MAAAFLTIPEVARLLRVGERTAYSLARSGELAGAVRVGSQWRVSRAVLEGWTARSDRTGVHGRNRTQTPHARRGR